MRVWIIFWAALLIGGCAPKVPDGATGGRGKVNGGGDVAPQSEMVPISLDRPYKLVTFNVEWFGQPGNAGRTITSERHQTELRRFMQANYADADVVVFQEIVDVSGLRSAMPGYNCRSYRAAFPKGHQHVVGCAKSPLSFTIPPYDNNYQIEALLLGRQGLRPAFHGLLLDGRQRPLMYVAGVHLKAFPDHSNTRLRQVQKLSRFVGRFQRTPVVVLGDFNSFEQSGRHEALSFLAELQRWKPSMQWVTDDLPKTYLSSNSRRSFDHIYVDGAELTAGRHEVFGVCRNDFTQYSFSEYKNRISDHCPVSVTVE